MENAERKKAETQTKHSCNDPSAMQDDGRVLLLHK